MFLLAIDLGGLIGYFIAYFDKKPPKTTETFETN